MQRGPPSLQFLKSSHRSGGGTPAHGVGEALLNLAHALVPARQHALIPFGVQHLGACIQSHSLAQGAHLQHGWSTEAKQDERAQTRA